MSSTGDADGRPEAPEKWRHPEPDDWHHRGSISLGRRAELTEAVLAYVLDHGLVGLSLRPLAASLGTSDRMLIYHFGSKSGLITAALELANHRLAATVRATATRAEPPRDGEQLIAWVWQTVSSPDFDGVSRTYLELCALSARDPDTWAGFHHQLRAPWLDLLRHRLAGLGLPADRSDVLATVILDCVDGFLLDRVTGGDPARIGAAALAFGRLIGDATADPPRRRPRT